MAKSTTSIGSRILQAALLTACVAGAAVAQAPLAQQTQTRANPVKVPVNPLKNAYFGQLHLHTGMSFDAYIIGTRLYPEDAYRFARGEEIEQDGRKIKNDEPLDFLGVSDHSEYLGQLRLLGEPDGPLSQTSYGKLFSSASPERRLALIFSLSDSFGSGGVKPPELLTRDLMKSNWQRQIDAAEKYNQPGKFTTFVAYEWSSLPNGANLHRNVIFRGPKYPELPFSSVDSANPEDLWRYIEHQRSNGIQALAIPHNSNVSDGLMWSYADSNRNPIDREYAEIRVGIERLVEITQSKGTSETRPELSPNDDFAGFELIDNLLTVPRASSINGSYVRQAYARGLELEQRTGVNPFEFGLIGGSDYHNGLSGSSESSLADKDPARTDIAKLLRDTTSFAGVKGSSAGLAGVWAESNTREAIFDALYRRETFATSGTRPRVRFFSSFKYPQGITKQRDWIKRAYELGVPMGADLYASASDKQGALHFLVQAAKDPNGANLDRIQIVKVWLENGSQKEQIFDVAWAGNRKFDASGKLSAIGSTVDINKATYTNDIGAGELIGEWQDPNFRPDTAAIYYARVLEIPTPRWTTYLAVQNKLPLPTSVASAIQERAWTSPIFYHP
jgi:Protein of unknown function (DUF3604)